MAKRRRRGSTAVPFFSHFRFALVVSTRKRHITGRVLTTTRGIEIELASNGGSRILGPLNTQAHEGGKRVRGTQAKTSTVTLALFSPSPIRMKQIVKRGEAPSVSPKLYPLEQVVKLRPLSDGLPPFLFGTEIRTYRNIKDIWSLTTCFRVAWRPEQFRVGGSRHPQFVLTRGQKLSLERYQSCSSGGLQYRRGRSKKMLHMSWLPRSLTSPPLKR